MKEVAVLGIGRTIWGKYPGKTWDDLAEEAVRQALKDAGLEGHPVHRGWCRALLRQVWPGCGVNAAYPPRGYRDTGRQYL